jgi:hypothetical protein
LIYVLTKYPLCSPSNYSQANLFEDTKLTVAQKGYFELTLCRFGIVMKNNAITTEGYLTNKLRLLVKECERYGHILLFNDVMTD